MSAFWRNGVGLLRFSKRRIKGNIGYFGLADWWLSAFTDEERRYIRERFQPLGFSGDTLTSGPPTSQTSIGFLSALAGWFLKADDRAIAYKILEKAEELAKEVTPVLDRHFMYQTKLELYYKDRDKPGYLENAIEGCLQQIELAPQAADAFRAAYKGSPLPGHRGYQQLAIILEKQANFREVIVLCARAQKEGWAGDWEKRIERCRKKMAKG
jgi:hypothetical protein